MSRKRIVAALLLVLTFGLGAACYLALRTNGSELADATPPEDPIVTAEAQPLGEIGPSGVELLDRAALASKAPHPSKRSAHAATSTEAAAGGAEEEIADTPSGEITTVAMESVDTPETSMVLTSTEDSGASGAGRPSIRLAGVAAGGRGGYSGGSGTGGTPPAGDTPPNSPPSDSGQLPHQSQGSGDSNPPPNEVPQTGGGQGTEPDPDEGQIIGPPYVEHPEDDSGYPSDDNGSVSVPEPGTLVLLGAGLAALGLGRRRLRK